MVHEGLGAMPDKQESTQAISAVINVCKSESVCLPIHLTIYTFIHLSFCHLSFHLPVLHSFIFLLSEPSLGRLPY